MKKDRPTKEKPDANGGYYKQRADGKYYYRAPDPNRYYRKDEMDPEVFAVLERARNEREVSPSTVFIDAVINWQNEKSPAMAIRYIKYKYLGECTYLEVFGKQGQEAFHYEQTENMLRKIDAQAEQIESMQKQLFQMQQLLINLAKSQNERHRDLRNVI